MESKTNEDVKVEDGKIVGKVEETQSVPEDEKIASENGWKAKDKWIEDGGEESDWKPAKVFNEVGDLKKKLQEKEKDNKKLNKVVTMMKDHHTRVRETAIQEAIKHLQGQRIAALNKDELGKAEEIRDKIDEIKESARTGSRLPPEIEQELQSQQQELPPAFVKFQDRNPWYKLGSKDAMTKKADVLGEAYHKEDPNLNHEEILNLVEKDIKRLFPEKFDTPKGGPNDSGSTRVERKSSSSSNLTAAEKQMAKVFDMSEADYAKELESYKGR